MYCDFFGLRDYPFLSTADRRFFYLSEGQAQAKIYLQHLLQIRDGIVVLTGEAGVGKSVLLDQLLKSLPEKVTVAHLHHTLIEESGFLLAVAMQLGCVPGAPDKTTLSAAILAHATDQHLDLKPVLIVIDEAQNLTPRMLEEIRLLANMELFGRKLIQFILLGQPELDFKFAAKANRAVAQLVRLQHRLAPLSRQEISEYIDYRLYVAGNDGRLYFPTEIIADIERYTGGIPRLINQLCDMMLVTAFINKTNTLDADCLERAIYKLGWPTYAERILPARKARNDAVDIRPLPLLVVRKGQDIVGRYLLNKKRMSIGSQAGADIRLDEPQADAMHAQLVNVDQQFFLHDLDSRFGCYLGANPIKWYELNDRDQITIGAHTLEYQLHEASVDEQFEAEEPAAALA